MALIGIHMYLVIRLGISCHSRTERIRAEERTVNEEQKKAYLEKYYKAKQKGVKFWPDIIYKDLLVIFRACSSLLVGLATFVGVANEPKADPSDCSLYPAPEWYFLFLFEMLKYFPGAASNGSAPLSSCRIAVLALVFTALLSTATRAAIWKQAQVLPSTS